MGSRNSFLARREFRRVIECLRDSETVEHAEFPPRTVRFGAFEIDRTNAELRKNGSLLRLQEQPFRILEALLQQPGEIVSREELVRRLWPDGTFVDFDRGLNAAVTRLRQALSDSAENPRYVETVARRGYRFIGPVESGSGIQQVESATTISPDNTVHRKPSLWIAAGVAAILCAAIVTGFWWIRFRPTPADHSLTVLPLTTDAGFAVSPTFSPDGSQIAYEWDQGRSEPRIFVKLVGPGEPHRLTQGATEESCPAWSPDGKFVAFVREISESRIAIFLVPALGGAERKVAEFARGTYYYPQYRPRLLTWTPDAKHLIAVIPNADSFSRLFLIQIDTGETTSLAESAPGARYWDRDPAVSPDGKLLVFTREVTYGSSDLQLVALTADWRESGKSRTLTSEIATGRYAQTPAWAPDGREIIYTSNRDASPRLWRIGLEPGAMPKQVNSVGPDSSLPAISVHGRLVYSHGSWDANIWRQNLSSHSTGLKASESLIASTAQDSGAQYSPDGTRIAFQSARSGNYEIWICGSDGGSCRQLTSFNGPLTGMPRWSQDGKKIAFDSAAGGTFHVYVIDAEGGSPRPVTSGAGNQVVPSWSHDGKWIYFSSRATGHDEIWKVPSSGGTAIQLTHKGGFTALESPDGHYLYYTRDFGKSGLFRSDVDGNAETAIAEDVIQRGFVPTVGRIFYLRQENDRNSATLRSLDLSTGANTPIAVFTKALDLGLSLSPDLKYALYAQVDSQGATLMLVDEFH